MIYPNFNNQKIICACVKEWNCIIGNIVIKYLYTQIASFLQWIGVDFNHKKCKNKFQQINQFIIFFHLGCHFTCIQSRVKKFCKLNNTKVFYDRILKSQETFYYVKQKKEVYKPKLMTEGKRNLIQGLLQEYDIQSAEEIQDALKRSTFQNNSGYA